MAQQRPNLPANIPQNLIPPRPAIPPSIQDIGQTGLTVHRLRTSKNTLGNVTDAELGAWDEYHHTLMVTRANVTGAQAAPAWFMQAFAQGGVANTAINQAIANANQISRARAINANATRDTDQLCEFPDIQGILPSAIGIVFPQNKGALRDNLTLGQYNALLAHYNQQIYCNRNNAKESLRVYLGVPPF
ncbi:hypothetical protein C1645_877046 [Glomus cerebriforme]|uniref:Uncharacterized protein n=1 Tax=Glomus cerebriforme TaxID=658196 RepID=A0A397SVE4_9GLOM|nr:hypothetical protein C1645_877046 [Glomus cerebriforme]